MQVITGKIIKPWIDEINITASLDDSDGDGLPDWWENIYFGDLDANPGDLSSNGVDTVYSAYIAGLDRLVSRFGCPSL